jgi:hypothetical protein
MKEIKLSRNLLETIAYDYDELKEYSNNAKMCNLSKVHYGGKW